MMLLPLFAVVFVIVLWTDTIDGISRVCQFNDHIVQLGLEENHFTVLNFHVLIAEKFDCLQHLVPIKIFPPY